jgi:hypothetical protein
MFTGKGGVVVCSAQHQRTRSTALRWTAGSGLCQFSSTVVNRTIFAPDGRSERRTSSGVPFVRTCGGWGMGVWLKIGAPGGGRCARSQQMASPAHFCPHGPGP